MLSRVIFGLVRAVTTLAADRVFTVFGVRWGWHRDSGQTVTWFELRHG
jgi:hypothetical protein